MDGKVSKKRNGKHHAFSLVNWQQRKGLAWTGTFQKFFFFSLAPARVEEVASVPREGGMERRNK